MTHHIEKIDIKALEGQWNSLVELVNKNDDKRHVVAMEIVEHVTDISNTVTDIVTRWDADIEKADLDYQGMPAAVLDYIDELIAVDKLKNAQDIIALFETGELRGIVDANNQIDKEALAVFERKIKKTVDNKPVATSTNDEEIF